MQSWPSWNAEPTSAGSRSVWSFTRSWLVLCAGRPEAGQRDEARRKLAARHFGHRQEGRGVGLRVRDGGGVVVIAELRERAERGLALLEEAYAFISARGYSPPDPHRSLIDAVMAIILAVGIRNLRAAQSLQRSGWLAESMPNVRAAWDAAVDIGLLLSGSRSARIQLAEQFRDMSQLRFASAEQLRAWSKPEQIQLRDALERRYKGSAGLDSRNHWSGQSRKKVREAADETIGADAIGYTTRTVFRLASGFVHGDPAAIWWYPIVDGVISVEPGSGEGADALVACAFEATLLVLLVAASKRCSGSDLDGRIQAFVDEALEAAKRHGEGGWGST
jgi:hypothetical protein